MSSESISRTAMRSNADSQDGPSPGAIPLLALGVFGDGTEIHRYLGPGGRGGEAPAEPHERNRLGRTRPPELPVAQRLVFQMPLKVTGPLVDHS